MRSAAGAGRHLPRSPTGSSVGGTSRHLLAFGASSTCACLLKKLVHVLVSFKIFLHGNDEVHMCAVIEFMRQSHGNTSKLIIIIAAIIADPTDCTGCCQKDKFDNTGVHALG